MRPATFDRALSRRALALVAAAVLAACATPPDGHESEEPAQHPEASVAESSPQAKDANVQSAEAPPSQRAAEEPPPGSHALDYGYGYHYSGVPSIRIRIEQPELEPEDEGEEIQRGKASWYGVPFHGRKTANGERYNMYELTAAHKTLPFGTVVKVKDLNSGRSVDVRINDRGPFVDGRVIDLSKAAADELGMAEAGVKPVSLTVVDKPDDAPEAAKDKPKAAKARSSGEKSGKKSDDEPAGTAR